MYLRENIQQRYIRVWMHCMYAYIARVLVVCVCTYGRTSCRWPHQIASCSTVRARCCCNPGIGSCRTLQKKCVCMYMYDDVDIAICIYTCRHIYIYIYTCMFVCTYWCDLIHEHIHVHIYVYKHTCIRTKSPVTCPLKRWH